MLQHTRFHGRRSRSSDLQRSDRRHPLPRRMSQFLVNVESALACFHRIHKLSLWQVSTKSPRPDLADGGANDRHLLGSEAITLDLITYETTRDEVVNRVSRGAIDPIYPEDLDDPLDLAPHPHCRKVPFTDSTVCTPQLLSLPPSTEVIDAESESRRSLVRAVEPAAQVSLGGRVNPPGVAAI